MDYILPAGLWPVLPVALRRPAFRDVRASCTSFHHLSIGMKRPHLGLRTLLIARLVVNYKSAFKTSFIVL